MNYIVILSEELQFQRASERCFVTQPTLSMQIKKAEDTLGYTIFDRDAQPLQLTPAGKRLLPIIREILAETEKIKYLSEQLKGNVKEEIRIGIIPTIATYLLPDLFSTWVRDFTNVRLKIKELKTTENIEALDRKELDLAIIAGPYHDPRLQTIPLYLEEICIYCPQLKTDTIHLEEIQKMHPWLLNQGNCLRTQMLHFCQLNAEQTIADWDYEGGNLPLLLEMVDQQGGYTLIPEHFKLKTAQKTGIKKLAEPFAAPAREIIALTPNRSMKTENIKALIRSIQLYYGIKAKDKHLQVLDWDVA
ncbi:MAG: LysR family transcriptional regulator [Flavobacteriales bacterium]